MSDFSLTFAGIFGLLSRTRLLRFYYVLVFLLVGQGVKLERRCQANSLDLSRTPGTGFSQYNGLANLLAFLIRSENFGLYYIPQAVTTWGS